MRMKANLLHKPINFQMDDCLIEKVVELSYEEFSALKIVPLQDQPFIAENKGCMFSRDGIAHCMLALGEGYHDGVLIDAEGYNCARLAAYIVGARDIVNAELGRAVERIVREATEHTSDGEWCLPFDALEERFGLNIRVGNGFDKMLFDKLSAREEVGGMTVRDVLAFDGLPESAFLAHKNSVFLVPVEDLKLLTNVGREDFAALLGARVADVRVDDGIPELLLEDVEASELDRLHDELEAHKQAEKAMGPVM